MIVASTPVGGVLCFLGFSAVAGVYAFAYPILKPALDAVKGRPPRRRFYLADFFWLLLMLQWPMVYVASVAHARRQPSVPWQLTGTILLLLVVFVWWRAATLLTTLGVEGLGRRSAFLGLVVPVAVLGALPVAFFCIAALAVSCSVRGEHWPALLVLPVPAGVFGLRRLCRWVVAGAEPWKPETAHQEPGADEQGVARNPSNN